MRSAAWIALFVLASSPPAQAVRPSSRTTTLELAARAPQVKKRRASPELAELERETAARWQVWWDAWTGAATRGRGAAAEPKAATDPWQRAQAFRQQHALLLGARETALARTRWKRGAGSWHATWQQTLAGERVEGCFLDLTLTRDARVVAFRSSLIPGLQGVARGAVSLEQARGVCEAHVGTRLETERHERVWVPVEAAGAYDILAAWRLELRSAHGARWRAWVDATTATVLAFESLLRTEVLEGATSGDIMPLYSTDVPESRRLAWLNVRLQRTNSTRVDSTFSDGLGNYRFNTVAADYELSAGLDGRFATVSNDVLAGESPGFHTQITIPGREDVRLDASNSRDDERTIYYHTNLIHDFVSTQFDFRLLDFPVPAVAAVRNPSNGSPDYANAFWDGNRMAFGNGGGGFQNFGLFADVIYHEYTHAITDHAYRPVGGLRGRIGGAIHEALSDYFACTITDEPLIGEFLAGSLALRDLDHDLVWPDDRDGNDEVHANGLILAGALWHTRALVGAEVADPIIHFARELFPQDFEEYLDAILIQDDLIFGDGAPGNGSPHRDAILTAFARHGMGPLGDRRVRIQHEALLDTEEDGVAREVRVRTGSLFPDAVDKMELHWRAGGAAFVIEPMQLEASGAYVAEIPGQPNGTRVDYWIRAVKLRPSDEQRLPAGAPDTLFSYRVGPDETPPQVTHAARPELPAFAWPADVHLRIQDNLGLAHAYVEYTLNGARGSTLGLVRSSEDPTLFTARFPNVGGQVGDVIEYWITAVDASRAANVTRMPPEGGLRMQLVRDLDEGFEHGAAAWMHAPVVAGRPDPWHLTTQFNHTTGGREAWWCGTSMGEYPASTAAALMTDWYRIEPGARASVWSWMDAEQNGPVEAFDAGITQVQVSGNLAWEDVEPMGGYTHRMSGTAGSNWLQPGTPCWSGRDDDWQLLEFDLSAWAGQRVRMRFLFGSDNQGSLRPMRGWLLDDFALDAGRRDPTDVPEARVVGPARVLVRPPWPNPFNPQVSFELHVPEGAGRVRLDVYDARGRFVSRLVDGNLSPSIRRVVWTGVDESGRESPSGTYFYRLSSRRGEEKGRLVLLR